MEVLDLFCGIGGWSTGFGKAFSREFNLTAVDSDLTKCAVFKANHPEAQVYQAELRPGESLFPEKKFDWILMSPPCTGFSFARGRDKEHSAAHRELAWTAKTYAAQTKNLLVENVVALLYWTHFKEWYASVRERFKFFVTLRAKCSNFGLGQIRERVFFVFSNHYDVTNLKTSDLPGFSATETSVASFLRWEETGLSRNWTPIYKPNRSDSTLRKIEASMESLGNRFVLMFYSSVTKGRSLESPISSLTTADRCGLIDIQAGRMRMLSTLEQRELMGFDLEFLLPESHVLTTKCLGDAVSPVLSEAIVRGVLACREA